MGVVKSKRQGRGDSFEETKSVFRNKTKPVPGNNALFSDNDYKQLDHSQWNMMKLLQETENAKRKGFLSGHEKHSAKSNIFNRCTGKYSHNQSPKLESHLLCCGNKLKSAYDSDSRSDSGCRIEKTEAEKAYLQQINLDTHPVVTRLQNEQNLRLEGMEQRMSKIRKSVEEEAERRKFAYLFQARTGDKLRTERLLNEASSALRLLKKDRRITKAESETGPHTNALLGDSHDCDSDKGDIIPVHVVPAKSAKQKSLHEQSECRAESSQRLTWLLQPIEPFHLSGLSLWLVLPFLLPFLLLLHVIRQLMPLPETQNHRKH